MRPFLALLLRIARRAPRHVALLALAGGLAALPAGASIYTVGHTDVDACTHHDVQIALLAAAGHAGADEVRLASNQVYNNQHIQLTNWSAANALTIAGGYTSCADATPSGTTNIHGASNPVVEIDTTDGNSSVITLLRLSIEDSSAAGILVSGDSTLTLSRSVVRDNAESGIRVWIGAHVIIDSLSEVIANSAPDAGGGVYCQSATVDIAGDIGKNGAGNVAPKGGGVHAQNCAVTLLDGAAIQYNQAYLDGGGLNAFNGTLVTGTGRGQGIWIAHNTADQSGGGISANGTATLVSLVNAHVESNQAGESGGGLSVDNHATLWLSRNAGPCSDAVRCSTLTSNSVVFAADGQAAWVGAFGSLGLFQTHIESNPPPGGCCDGPVDVIEAVGTNAEVLLEGVSFWNNAALNLIQLGNGASADVRFVSASGNGDGGPARPIRLETGSAATLLASIFWPSAPVSVAAGATITDARCLVLSSTSGLPAGATAISTADPQFVDAGSGNLHLPPASPAVDFCDTSHGAPSWYDLDNQPHGFDQPGNVNGTPGVSGGVFDIGADEVSPVLFADGFELGLAVWSGRRP